MKNSDLLITGGSGMVGSAFKQVLPDAVYPTRQELRFMLKSIFHKQEFEGKRNPSCGKGWWGQSKHRASSRFL